MTLPNIINKNWLKIDDKAKSKSEITQPLEENKAISLYVSDQATVS
jgi:hypothetical protein